MSASHLSYSAALWIVLSANLLAGQQQPDPRFATLTGTVVSGFTSLPVQGAVVQLRPAGPGRPHDAMTDSSGSFKIDSIVPGRYAVRVMYISYSPTTTQLDVEPGVSLMRTFALTGECKFDSLRAMRDVRDGHPKVLLHGGIAPSALTSQDQAVERTYGFRYYDFGDVIENPYECDDEYNRVVFRSLDRKYGSNWRAVVRTH